eukprot:4877500-Karenia_brevis.AAC.1
MVSDDWVTFEGLKGVMTPQSGASAGRPLADMLFVVAFSFVIRGLSARLAELGVISDVGCAGASEYYGIDLGTDYVLTEPIAYVDDILQVAFCRAADAVHTV